MIQFQAIKKWMSWRLVRANLCTLAVAWSFNCTWRVPREAMRFGGLQYSMVLTVAMLVVAMPAALLQLAAGQLSQQDAVGVWRAVPFFKGIGYIRLLISFIGSAYTVIYISLTVALFVYTLSNSIPFERCTKLMWADEAYVNVFNASECLSSTFMAPAQEAPEYFVANSLIIIFMWIVLPFLLFTPVRVMKRTFYTLGPLVLLLVVVASAGMIRDGSLMFFVKAEDWKNFLHPNIWFSAASQALISSEVAGGYLISAGDAIYSNNNVQWTALVFVGTNIVTSWLSLLFWFGISGSSDMDSSPIAALVQVYRAGEAGLATAWPLLVLGGLALSGVVSLLTRLYPVFERMRRACGVRWRAACACACAAGAACSLGVLAARWDALLLLEDVVVPALVATATVLELTVFVTIYGWTVLAEDVEFLIGCQLNRLWVVGWIASPVVLLPSLVWWVVIGAVVWSDPPYTGPALVAAASVMTAVVIACAVVAVATQVQYDFFGKLKSSFKPSRHWGPRDPITHYYWLARRDVVEGGNTPASRYRRRELGQLPGNIVSARNGKDLKRRSNSDDWIYTLSRKNYLESIFPELYNSKKRSKSMDWGVNTKMATDKDSLEVKFDSSVYDTAEVSAKSMSIDGERVYGKVTNL